MEEGEIIMPRFNDYQNNLSEIKNITAEGRNAGRVNEVNRSVNDVRSEVLSLRIMVQAMMEIMADRGISPDVINAKIEEITNRPETFDAPRKLSTNCPGCGRLILDNGNTPLTGTCLYCGKVVKFAPKFESGSGIKTEAGEQE
ncbi:MAG: hypothetical protein IKX20_11915 [Paludibacteraceae bacterium]|nr:hypothetical protein [Paludibacteraceae bacterium]